MRIEKIVEDVAFRLLHLAVTELPYDVKEALDRARQEETDEIGVTQLQAMLANLELAQETRTPICQDTGTIIFYIKAGTELHGLGKIKKALCKATVKATKEIPLRPNAVNPITQENTGNNTGRFLPFIHWDLNTGDTLEITVVPKGGGSENFCTLSMLSPTTKPKDLTKFIIKALIDAGGKPCPPLILGIGIGGGADIAMSLAKAALLKPLNQPNENPTLEKLETEIFEAANSIGIGPMGLGGRNTVLGVRIEYAHRHPASYPVALAAQCWAARRASALIHSDGVVEYLTHEVI